MLSNLLLCLGAYCLGSIPSAIVVCRLMGLPDPRTTGSKNPGSTNVLRMGNKPAAILTLLGDVLKGLLPVLMALHLDFTPFWVGAVMVSVCLGHTYPVFFGFQGGKGVATAAGVFLALNTFLGLILISSWLLVVLLFRFVALGAVVVAVLAPFIVMWYLGPLLVIPVAMISALILWRHQGNMQRLWQGVEPKIGKK
ncbi:MAG: glycerol-3-phosphate 1-O-acyltransferase PlsY [Gammaproteobacteria bacterium]|nr:glycerol-3-phosphate 1-O-acyltransferase PlsY [Gammaproteobacteria bacterium]MBP9728930.1 glycerol-3-phosphate 1-O-acyltransferase PlsY [Gammaproteobacteria bacterium]